MEHAPVVWQVKGGEQVPVPAEYRVASGGSVSFALGAYDRSLPLIIDPTLDYSTYLGGSSGDSGRGIAVDAAGNAFITGYSPSADFPTRDATQPACSMYGESCTDEAFVTKLDASGTLVYSTFLGGSGTDIGNAIAVDAAGNAFITGDTLSKDFPTRNALQPACGLERLYNSCSDAFVTKLDASGTLVYSTYLGGNGGDDGNAIAVDAAGNAVVTGYTTSRDFPTHNALQPACSPHYNYQGCSPEAFVTKLDASGSVVWSTYLGGSANDNGSGIAVDAVGSAFVTGGTHSIDFPTRNALQPACSAPYPEGGACSGDGFVTKLDASGMLVYSTYLRAGSVAIAVDAAGNALLTGTTASTDFPTHDAMQPTCSMHRGYCTPEAFVMKLDVSGMLAWSTYLGGSAADYGTGIAVDAAGNAFITGTTYSADFPTRNALQATCTPDPNASYKGSCFSDAFVTKLDVSGMLAYSTYLGGSQPDESHGIAADAAGNAFITGSSYSADFPTHNALQPACTTYSVGACSQDAFIAKIGGAELCLLGGAEGDKTLQALQQAPASW